MSKTISNESFMNQLQWRYATKKFDSKRKITKDTWRTLEETLVLAPSSYGLQPWKFFVVTSQTVRTQLLAASWGQPQIVDASHLVVFAIKKDFAAKDVDRHIARIAKVRQIKVESLIGLRNMILGVLDRLKDGLDIDGWTARQTYIALGNFLTAAAVLGIDACPMEGFDPAKYDEILGLSEQGYSAVVVCTAGYRASDDEAAGLPKVRFEKSEVIAEIT